MPEAMSEKRLEEVKANAANMEQSLVSYSDVNELIAEIKRLKEHNIVLSHALEKASNL